MRVSNPYNNKITIINDFVSKDEIKFMLDYFDKFYSSDRNSEKDYDQIKITAKHKFAELQHRAEKLFYELFDFTECDFTDIYNFGRLQSGGISPHADDLKDGADQTVHYGAVLYWNDSFEGGELNYTNLGIKYKPVPGDLVFHPGTEEYTHGVDDVTSGTRYTSTMFVKSLPY
jgi:hypothetical protein